MSRIVEAHEHDPAKLVDSSAIRAINVLIDRKTAELIGNLTVLLNIKERYGNDSYPPSIDTRVSYEDDTGRRGEVLLPMDPHNIKYIRSACDAVDRLKDEINELQRYKLRLLNDWDFTHGDNKEQIAVFGEP